MEQDAKILEASRVLREAVRMSDAANQALKLAMETKKKAQDHADKMKELVKECQSTLNDLAAGGSGRKISPQAQRFLEGK